MIFYLCFYFLVRTMNSGYDYDFVCTPPDRLICEICHLPSREPHLSGCCGHTFCKACLYMSRKEAVHYICPVCRSEEFVTIANKQVDREIKSLTVYCPNKKKGCEWTGEVYHIVQHLDSEDGCRFEEVLCSNNCGMQLQRLQLEKHLNELCPCRQVECPYCSIKGKREFIEDTHKEQCPKLPLSCPNNCDTEVILREDLDEHRKVCLLELITCDYHDVGCECKMPRRDEDLHNQEQMAHHLNLTKRKLTATESELSTTVKKLKTAEEKTSELQASISEQLKVFYNTQVWPFKLLSMASIANHGNQTVPVTVRMPEFARERNSHGQWFSPPFFTHDKGYKMCFRIDPDGSNDGKGTHMSVFMYVIPGPYDDMLPWPLTRNLTVKLLNQISDSDHFSLTVTFSPSVPCVPTGRVIFGARACNCWGWSRFISHEDMYNVTPTLQYIKDDCIYLSVS